MGYIFHSCKLVTLFVILKDARENTKTSHEWRGVSPWETLSLTNDLFIGSKIMSLVFMYCGNYIFPHLNQELNITRMII